EAHELRQRREIAVHDSRRSPGVQDLQLIQRAEWCERRDVAAVVEPEEAQLGEAFDVVQLRDEGTVLELKLAERLSEIADLGDVTQLRAANDAEDSKLGQPRDSCERLQMGSLLDRQPLQAHVVAERVQ